MSYFFHKFNDIPDFIKKAGTEALPDKPNLPIKRKISPIPSFLKEPLNYQEEDILKKLTATAQKKYPFKGEKKNLPLLTYLLEHPLEFVLETKCDFPEKWDWLKKDMLFLIELLNTKTDLMKIEIENNYFNKIDDIWQESYHLFDIISSKNKRNSAAKLSENEEIFTAYMKKIKELFDLPEEPFMPEKNKREYLEKWLLKNINKEKIEEILQKLNIKIKRKPVEENQGLLPF